MWTLSILASLSWWQKPEGFSSTKSALETWFDFLLCRTCLRPTHSILLLSCLAKESFPQRWPESPWLAQRVTYGDSLLERCGGDDPKASTFHVSSLGVSKLWPKSGPPLVFIYKVLLGHSHAHLFTYGLLLLSYHCEGGAEKLGPRPCHS